MDKVGPKINLIEFNGGVKFFIFDCKYLFWGNLVPKFKIV